MLLIEPEAVLETERLRLEPLLRCHAAILFPLLQDEHIYRYVPQDPPIAGCGLGTVSETRNASVPSRR